MCMVLLSMQSCGEGSDKVLKKAQDSLQAGKFADAEILFRKVLAEEPQNPAAKVGLARAFSRQGNLVEAWDAYRDAEKSAPGDASLLEERIEIGYGALRSAPSRMRKLEEEVTELCNRVLKLKANSVVALRTRGYLALRLGYVEMARKDYEAAWTAVPQDAETMKAVFAIWVNSGETQKAIGAVQEVLAKNPRFEAGYQILYGYYLRRKQFADARGVLEAKHKVLGTDSGAALELALHEERAGNVAEAKKILEELEAKRPGTAKYRMDLSAHHARLGRVDAALAEVEKGLQGFADQKMNFLQEKAKLLLQKGMVQEAADLLSATYAEFPKNTALLQLETQMRVQLSDDLGQRGKAELLFAKLRSLEPVPAGTDALYVRFLQASGRAEEANQVLAQGLKKNPSDVDLLILQARQALAVSAPTKAMGFATRAFQLRSSWPEVAATLADCFTSNGMWQPAEEFLQEWRENNQPSTEVDIQLAAVYAKQKKKLQARELLDSLSKRKLSSVGQVITMARALQLAGEGNRAMSLIEAELRLRADAAALLGTKAELLEQAGQGREALALLRQLTEKRPNGELLLRVARLEAEGGNLSAAAEVIQKAEQVAPGDMEVKMTKSALLEAQRKYGEAEGILRRLHNAEPRSARIANALAWNLAMQGKASEAKPIAAIAVKEDASSLNYRDTAAWISLQLKELNQAKTDYLDLVRQDNQNAAYHFHLVETLLAMKDPMAKAEYAKAMAKGAVPAECKDLPERMRVYVVGGI